MILTGGLYDTPERNDLEKSICEYLPIGAPKLNNGFQMLAQFYAPFRRTPKIFLWVCLKTQSNFKKYSHHMQLNCQSKTFEMDMGEDLRKNEEGGRMT